jgi:16S rRNA (adenine1518-N6/adenine1519-N6)-dimethyltransferase
MVRAAAPVTTMTREEVFRCIDAAFAQRRRPRAVLAGWAEGSGRQAHCGPPASTRAPAATLDMRRSRRSPS